MRKIILIPVVLISFLLLSSIVSAQFRFIPLDIISNIINSILNLFKPTAEPSEKVIPSSGTIVYSSPLLHVCEQDETKLCDGNGNEVYLKGIQVDWNERRNENGKWFTFGDVGRLKEAGGNIMEIHIERWKELMPERDICDETYFENWLNKWVSWCEKNKIYCIINIQNCEYSKEWGQYKCPQWLVEGKYNPPYDEAVWEQANVDFFDLDNPLHDDNRQSFINLWKFVAERYKNNPYIMFGLMNEPLCGNSLMNGYWSEHIGRNYSSYMEQVVYEIRDTGAEQIIFIDRPFIWYLYNVHPVDRENIVWEDHLYVTQNTDIEEWKDYMDGKVQRFVYDFGKPLFIGEYGTDNPIKPTNWQDALSAEVSYLKTKPLCGQQWHHWGALNGEYYDNFNAEESEWILQTVLG